MATLTPTKTDNKTQQDSKPKSKGQKKKSLEELLQDGLKDAYSAEMQLVEALPKMAKACESEELQDAFMQHLQETKRHAERLEKVFTKMGIEKNEIETCKAMEGLIAEGNKIIEEYEESPVKDSALIIAAQKVEHYEIATYGSLCELCDVLGYQKVGDLLGRTLEDEERTDDILTDIAQQINDEAYEMSEQNENQYKEEE